MRWRHGLPKQSTEQRFGEFELKVAFEPGRGVAFQIMPLQNFSVIRILESVICTTQRCQAVQRSAIFSA
jgi:hypothetical protein